MHLWLKKSALIATMLMLFSSIAAACPEGKDWKSFSTISVTYGLGAALTLTRFSDGVYARVEDEKSIKEMYQLNNGMYLYKGYDPSKQKGPSPFFMLDMPIGMVIGFLAEHFKHPCLIASAPTPFSYVRPWGKSTIDVSGSAYRVDVSTIIFDLTAVEQQERGANIKASGKLAFFDITPVPPDTPIADWLITRNSGMGAPAEPVEQGQMVETIRNLGTLIQQKPKQ